MEKPVLSPDFTMEDLYKLREYDSLRRYKMTTEELIADIRKGADEGLAQIEQIRKAKKLAAVQ